MSLLQGIKTDDTIKEEKDSLGGFVPTESGIYPCKVTMAYLRKSAGGASAIVVNLNRMDTGKELRIDPIYFTSGDVKGNRTFYTRDGQNHNLPGFTLVNALAKLTTGKALGKQETGEKAVKVYNYEAKAEVPTTVEALLDVIGKEVYVGVIDTIEDKSAKDGSGNYVPTGQTRRKAVLSQFFNASDKRTSSEISSGVETAEFYDDWLKKWEGQTNDRSTKMQGTAANASTLTTVAAASNAPKKSLFEKG